jgi:hypothetical protein
MRAVGERKGRGTAGRCEEKKTRMSIKTTWDEGAIFPQIDIKNKIK